MRKRNIHIIALTFLISAIIGQSGTGGAETESLYKKVDIDVNKEDKEVGLKRLELIDKVLSQDMMNRKRDMVRNLEADYSEKTRNIIDSIISPIFENKVFTHIDVNFFSPDFESEVRASQKVSVSIILKKDGFNTWVEQNPSEQDAMKAMKQLLGNTFHIPVENISILVVN